MGCVNASPSLHSFSEAALCEVQFKGISREGEAVAEIQEGGLQSSRLVDIMGSMTSQSKHRQENRQIVGFSLSPEMARDVKAEAGRRGVSLRKLFEEMWAGYKAPPKP